MSEKDKLEMNTHLFSLVSMFASACWQQLGKVASQVDGKVHRDLDGAKFTIDMLLMLRDKMKGNLNKKEEEFLLAAISDLQLNFADEIIKPAEKINCEDTAGGHSCGCGCDDDSHKEEKK